MLFHVVGGGGVMGKPEEQSETLAARPVVDPDLPQETKELLLEDLERPYRFSGGRARPVAEALQSVLPGGAAVTLGGLSTLWIANLDPDPTLPSGYLLSKLQELVPLLSMAVLLGMSYIILLTAVRLHDAHSYNDSLDRLSAAKNQVVDPDTLPEEARTLLARAQHAQDTVLHSAVHREGLLDSQRNTLLLPAQEWDIARSLREYGRLVAQEPAEPESERVATLLRARRRELALTLAGVERRVVALETYARETVRADSRYAERRQLAALEGSSSEVLDLLAHTARDDLAVAELESMTGEVDSVAPLFTDALESARLAAVTALPRAVDTA